MHSLVGHQPRTSAFKLPWTSQHRRHNHRDHHQLPKKWVFECAALSKQGQRLLSSAGVAAAEGDSVATSRLIKKFVGASPKHVALDALSHLLNPHSAHAHLSSLAFPLVSKSTSVYVKKQGCKSMINGLCEMSRPREAEILIEEMRGEGVKPSLFELRCVVYAYGRLGFFQEMKKCIDQMEKEGIKVDTVCSNMILASYGAHNALLEMVLWLRKMKNLGIPFSIRTCNSVLNSCPTIMSTVQNSNDKYPISIHELTEILSENEGLLVKEIVESSILDEVVKWDESESKVDLHGLHLCSAYVVMLIWIEETRKRFGSGKYVIPSEIRLVCGSGKHSIIRGESPVKSMVKEIMVRTKSPMRIDRKNTGCFIAKGKIVKEWLCANNDSSYFTVS
ncbi:pentatricopeptide repeat-containing protein At2g17033 isoform X2 [Mercurialis annua]|uniref:pentatricopeptide repeat-containing protein At2g17033 isoform X2 n=1 Tax=Mercurialis annua TaxID=3986 RepID=UPI002160B05A|nr:pentatricopeptide repeat-containing protein At2g17033 isoform X2 [Mercurialis annua]